ncbi:NAD(P)/FAD-dependent oxidoreductase [Mucilaginibacter rigui]|uniref:NAD(P)/FAD-dependent oxidoreductase n=1 Tax=Mucilaginibacter rigui TaxID=534635 RepID=A0ABR7X2L4_9SPHI|nr:NAD(P)/FAD-dependent oxidoreductase [Mucilaginibacter rigui]MBD1384766.1 NAD(P)/FAD-dependent oxidoreductase [Mucilaginibacter rigui]
MKKNQYEVIIIGGSFAGLSAAMALGRSVRRVLVIDNGDPCNKKTPHSHNFLTNDGATPADITMAARRELAAYKTVKLVTDTVENVVQIDEGFKVTATKAQTFITKKVLIATGLKDIMPNIPGFADCWGTSVIHCPYCHGYEVYQEKLAVFGNGDEGFEFAKLINNWSRDLTLFTNGISTFNPGQEQKLKEHGIKVIQTKIAGIDCVNNQVQAIKLIDGTEHAIRAIFARVPFKQHTDIPEQLGCVLTEQGQIQTDKFCATTIPGIYAAGDNSSPLRGVANAVANGTMAGVFINKALIDEAF